MSERVRQQAFSFHRNTWFHVRNSPGLIRTLCGTRPGDGWADLLFNFVMMDLLRIIQDEMVSRGLMIKLQWNGKHGLTAAPGTDASVDFLAPTWADDVAFSIQHDDDHAIQYLPKLCDHYGLFWGWHMAQHWLKRLGRFRAWHHDAAQATSCG
jgi:hypothetical protein